MQCGDEGHDMTNIQMIFALVCMSRKIIICEQATNIFHMDSLLYQPVILRCFLDSGRRAVHLSTRSGAWIIPNYVFGSPTDLYASRFLLQYLPFKLRQFVLEVVVRLIFGSPYK